MDVDAVQQRPADPLLIATDRSRSAGAGPPRVTKIAAGTRIHGGDEGEVGREGEGAGGPSQRYRMVLQGLAQPFQLGGAELRQLVEEEDAAVGQADLSLLKERPTT